MQDMQANFFTKPLQVSLFMWLQDKILNLPTSTSASVHRSVLEDQRKQKAQKYSEVWYTPIITASAQTNKNIQKHTRLKTRVIEKGKIYS